MQAHLVFLLDPGHAGERALDKEGREVLAVTFAKTMKRSAKPQLVIHIFSPFSVKLPSGCRVAVARAPSTWNPSRIH